MLTLKQPQRLTASHSTIPQLSSALARGDDGIWYADRQAEISHPEVCQDWYREVEDRSYWFKHRANCLVDLLRRFPPQGAIFDIGGGSGVMSLAMLRAGVAPVLVEPSQAAAASARSRGLRDVICSTLQDAQFHEGCLPAAAMFDVLEHIQYQRQILTDVAAALKPGGRLYITVPAYSWLWSEHDDNVGHFRRYTTGALRRALRDSGFDVEHASYIFAPLTLPILLMRSLPYRILGGGRATQQSFAKEHATDGGPLSRAMDWLLRLERWWARHRFPIPLGSSCIAVAHKHL